MIYLQRPVENYFNYFTEIEERYQKRRGTGLLLSTLDWALVEIWKDAGVPLEAVLSGIDETFDKYDRRPRKARKINSLAYCSQEVLAAAEHMKEAAAGAHRDAPRGAQPGLCREEIQAFLVRNAKLLSQTALNGAPGHVEVVAQECAAALAQMAETMSLPLPQQANTRLAGDPVLPQQANTGLAGDPVPTPLHLEDMERRLTALEEKLIAALTLTASDLELAGLNAEADREIGPYRSKMPAFQIEQLKKQFVHKRLFEKAKLPRLSLFYM